VLQDRIRWNEKYRRGGYPDDASGILRDYWGLAPGRSALDIAAGNGRNALFLAERGFKVDAVDISDEGLRRLAGRHPLIRPVCADLDIFDIPAGRYDLIVDVLYLNRRLFPQIVAGLRPGGVLVFETLLEPPEGEAESGNRRDYYLRENELLLGFLSLRIVYYREQQAGGGAEGFRRLASLVGVKEPARR
jgi:SAM-dependent methyltransferase